VLRPRTWIMPAVSTWWTSMAAPGRWNGGEVLVPARCKGRGGLLVLDGRARDVKPGWRGLVPAAVLAASPFLETIPEVAARIEGGVHAPWPDDHVVVIEEGNP